MVRAGASDFSVPLQRVQIGGRSNFFRTAAEMLGCLPAVILTPGDFDFREEPEVQVYLGQTLIWDLNLLTRIPESGDGDAVLLDDESRLTELFSGDDLALDLEPEGYEIQEVTPLGLFHHSEFQELDEPLPIAWSRLRIQVQLASW